MGNINEPVQNALPRRTAYKDERQSKLKYKDKGKKDKNIFETIGLFQELPENPICAFLEHDGSDDCNEAQEKESEMSGRKYASKKQRKSSKCDGKKKKVKKKKVIDYSVIEKNMDIDEREPVAGIDSEIPAQSKVTTSKPKHKKARKSSSFTNFVSIPMQMEDIMQARQLVRSEGYNVSEEPPTFSKRVCKKKKLYERENATNHSIVEKIHYINEREPVTKIHSESPAEIRDTADKPKPKKVRKSASDANFILLIPREMKDVTPAKESEKSSEKYVPEEQPMTSKCNGEKKNVEEREYNIEHSISEKTQNINLREPVIEIHSENAANSEDASDEPETENSSESVSVAGYDIENLPKGWDRRIIIRKTGKTAGQIDIYFYSPDGIKLRSRRDIAAYLARTKSNLKIEDFDFSKKSISGKHLNSSLKHPYRKRTVNHTCETIRLLQELQEDPVCACHEQDDDDSSEASSENEFNDFPSINNSKSPNKSKQLIIYNDKGCMKGVEIGKETATDNSTTLLRERTMKEPYVLIKNKIDPESHDYSSNSTIPASSKFSYKREEIDITDSDTGDTINLMSQAFPQYDLAGTFKRKKKRGWQKGRPRKASANIDPSRIPSSNQRSVPYTNSFLGQQSYTQVSFEEVHLAQPKKARGRPHKSNSNKSSREMLILKRKIQKKIVHNRGFEYPATGITKHYHSNINEGHSFNGSPQSKQIVKAADQSSQQLVKKRASRCPNAQEKYGPELLPPGWDTAVITRKSGKSAGQVDVYFVTPEGKRVRSRSELSAYIEKNNLPFIPEEFIFRKSAYISKLPMIEYNKDSS